ncbi:nucleoside hydrolase-like domain-containing protein [Leeuwenhoekiella parthenopeia]|uniref:Cellulose-binding Sde182 nucleoside hydrolase-like domain-containing protein n=1 Tax=Leeuwenhoekiella parthenopeia TaxID=2890320 RepID=A0ABS8GP32_9FLAO|nr:nucleoside hydrolase-like domain-containing protein [Leeuwenhoekiella parthenopeia]MCC4211273.1 hypothetical protein [Leeuwenhoekiella parthenopeia]
MKISVAYLLTLFFLTNSIAQTEKINVWIFTDMTDKTLKGTNHMGTLNDPDDISALAGYLLMSNLFNTKGIVVGSTHRSEHKNTPNQAKWAQSYFGEAYGKDLKGLSSTYSGYQKEVPFIQSSIMANAEHYDPTANYRSLSKYNSIKALFKEVKKSKDTLNVLIWGSTTEPAIFVKHIFQTGQEELLKRVRFIAHWTNSALHQGTLENPEAVANCNEDRAACTYMKNLALKGNIQYYELGAIGQHGLVSGAPSGIEYYSQFNSSHLGQIFLNGKYVNDKVDHSDAATYWVLLGKYGVHLNQFKSNGSNNPVLEKQMELNLRNNSLEIHNVLLARSNSAANGNFK